MWKEPLRSTTLNKPMERKKQVTLSFLNGLFISQTTEVFAGLRLCASLWSVSMYRYVILCKQHVAVGLKPVPLGGLDATFFQMPPSQMGFHADKSRKKNMLYMFLLD